MGNVEKTGLSESSPAYRTLGRPPVTVSIKQASRILKVRAWSIRYWSRRRWIRSIRIGQGARQEVEIRITGREIERLRKVLYRCKQSRRVGEAVRAACNHYSSGR